jgi:adenylate cyclase class 2
MASNGIEVEIKVAVSEPLFHRIRSDLLARFGEPNVSQQTDAYFNAPHRDFLATDPVSEWLSVRSRGNRTILNYKRFLPSKGPVFSHCEESETEVGDRVGLEKMLAALGFSALVTVEKRRESFLIHDEFEIALDSVTELGFFVEVEALKDFGGVEMTRKAVHALAESLGLDVAAADTHGYPWLLLKKKGLLD